jgi:hypothetical protein
VYWQSLLQYPKPHAQLFRLLSRAVLPVACSLSQHDLHAALGCEWQACSGSGGAESFCAAPSADVAESGSLPESEPVWSFVEVHGPPSPPMMETLPVVQPVPEAAKRAREARQIDPMANVERIG